METAGQLLQTKQSDIWSVTPDASAYDAVKLMADKDIGALLVIEGEKLLGIVSERDYITRLILKGKDKSPQDTPVTEIMTRRLIYVRPEQSVEECMAIMVEKGVRHLPILESGQLLGVISIRDVIKGIITEKEFMIEQLAEYITIGY